MIILLFLNPEEQGELGKQDKLVKFVDLKECNEMQKKTEWLLLGNAKVL